MLIALGMFLAGFAVFLLAPFYRRRAARLATDALRRSMPLTEAEIRADKDRLRAEHAIAIHKLESKVEDASLSAARQMVEINRRDAAISALESTTAALRTSLEEHENARRVLEQTITDRLPRVESRLSLAKKQLFQRDQEISTLTQSSNRYSQALEEATQINTQQRDDIHRLNATITTRAARNREPLGADARFDSEVALRAEIEALRTKARDQSALISRLQGVMVATGAKSDVIPGLNTGVGSIDARDTDAEVVRLRDSLSEAESALKAVRSTANAGHAGSSQIEAGMRALKSENQDQKTEIARLKAALNAYVAEDANDKAMPDSKIAMKARINSLQAQATQYSAIIQSLRAEIAAANEKLARQASQYVEEMRRLGAGTMPVTGPGRRDAYEAPAAPSLAARISAPRPVPAAQEAPPVMSDAERVSSNFMRALTGNVSPSAGNDKVVVEAATDHSATSGSVNAEALPPAATRRRPSLLERLTSADKPAASRG